MEFVEAKPAGATASKARKLDLSDVGLFAVKASISTSSPGESSSSKMAHNRFGGRIPNTVSITLFFSYKVPYFA